MARSGPLATSAFAPLFGDKRTSVSDGPTVAVYEYTRWYREKMSALGKKADNVQRTGRCPLYPRKRTCALQLGMSALGQ